MVKKWIKDSEGIEVKVPRRDGSGRGMRLNRGRNGCAITEEIGRGRREWD